MTKIVQHLGHSIDAANSESLTPVFDRERPILSTADMGTWYTGKAVGPAMRSHINHCVHDSTYERASAHGLDTHPAVKAWVKNDHLGFEILYVHRGVVRRYVPDFLIRLESGITLVLEVKGNPRDVDQSKWAYMKNWVAAVNSHGGFGHWNWDVLTPDKTLTTLLDDHSRLSIPAW